MFKKSAGILCALTLSFATVAFAQTDAALTASVKTKLAADEMVKAVNVNVSSTDHVVTLTGVVGSRAEKDRALTIARDTTGVTSVVDKLTVKPMTTATAGKTTSEKAAGGVEKGVDKAAGGVEKGADKSADAVGTAAHKTAEGVDKSKSKIGEAAEKTGDALGTAAKATGKAVGTAARKTGEAVGVGADKTKEATAKAADKTASGTAKAADKTKEATETAGDKTKDKLDGANDTAGAVVSDAAITSAVKTKLLGDGKTPGLKIDVDTDDGVVTLSGDVATATQHASALRLARGTKGVKRVVDHLTVTAK